MSAHDHPVQLHVDRPLRTRRIHAVTRLLLLLAIGALGCSSIYGALYLALPGIVAILIAQKGGERYLAEDGPRIVRVLRWFSSAYAYLWLLTDVVPTAGAGAVDLRITLGGNPTTSSVLLRVLTSIPATVLLVLLSLFGGLAWVIALVFVLIRERMPRAIADFLVLTLRVQFRLVAYHLSLVDRYPSMSAANEGFEPAMV
jgi:hypothetical protein